MLETIVVRAIFILLFAAVSIFFRPAGEETWPAACFGALLGIASVIVAVRLQRVTLKRFIGLGVGLLTGLICAALVSSVVGRLGNGAAIQFVQIACVLLLMFVGGSVGSAKGDQLQLGSAIGAEASPRKSNYKILDTSVVIDGRIADIADTGFLDGILVVPQFVLHELQMVADSADSMKRNRGRRGLDVLQRIQKMAHLQVLIVEQDFPVVKEVDMKLIELAKVYECKIITNDFNLNKVAQLRGVEVLNINELANALKPIVLPGETMRVFILKEGKEYNQGVAYLDDGTMVVVDNARRMISKTIDVSVTSVLQTTAGKMIFGKFDERAQSASAAAGAALPGPPSSADRPPRREQTVGEN